MLLFMDMHSLDGGVSASDAAAAHEADLATGRPMGSSLTKPTWPASTPRRRDR